MVEFRRNIVSPSAYVKLKLADIHRSDSNCDVTADAGKFGWRGRRRMPVNIAQKMKNELNERIGAICLYRHYPSPLIIDYQPFPILTSNRVNATIHTKQTAIS